MIISVRAALMGEKRSNFFVFVVMVGSSSGALWCRVFDWFVSRERVMHVGWSAANGIHLMYVRSN